jgi:hypothetical protein
MSLVRGSVDTAICSKPGGDLAVNKRRKSKVPEGVVPKHLSDLVLRNQLPMFEIT